METAPNDKFQVLGCVVGDVPCVEVTAPSLRHTISTREAYRLARDLIRAVEDAEGIIFPLGHAAPPTARGQEERG